jgi:hypothetical protein
VWFVIEVGIKGGRERRGFNEMEKSGEYGDEILAEHGSSPPDMLDALGNDRICHEPLVSRGPIRICLSTFYFVNFVVYALFLGSH